MFPVFPPPATRQSSTFVMHFFISTHDSHLSHQNPEREEPGLPGGIRATRTGSASRRPGVGRADWFPDEPISERRHAREGRAKIIQATGLKENGQVRQVPGLCTHSGTHGIIISLGTQA